MSNPMLTYSVIGSGVWGKKVIDILRMMGRKARPVNFPYKDFIGKDQYFERLHETLKKEKRLNDILWVAIPPKEQFRICELATDVGFHQIFEKPWNVVNEQAKVLHNSALKRGVSVGVHFQYCYLDRLRYISDVVSAKGVDTTFSGIFNISRNNRLGLDALENLGVHLVAIKMRHFESSNITSIEANYDKADMRRLQLTDESGGVIEALNFYNCKEPIVQKYIIDFENSIGLGEPFQLDMEFARKVNVELASIKKKGRS